MMLANDKIHPRLAFAHCGLFVDPELAYLESKEYYDEQMAKEKAYLKNALKTATENARNESNLNAESNNE